MKSAVAHVVVSIGFIVLAIVWTLPLVLHLSTHLPGSGLGDNALFLWNFWWMRMARASGADFFHTTYLFAPVGTDLTLHTHTALPAFVGATLLGRLPVVQALNLTILLSVALNGFCAYLLAWRTIRQRGASVVAGIIFATSPYIAAHLDGHFNLVMAWTIPLFALSFESGIRGSIAWSIFAGVVLAATAYIDYYYLVYEIALALCMVLIAAGHVSIETGPRASRRRPVVALICVAIFIDLLAVVIFGTFNALQLLWILVLLALVVWFRLRIIVRRADTASVSQAAICLAVTCGVFLIGAIPLLRNAAALLLHGEYVSQTYFWRSSPIGIDVATMLLGNPFHSLWGRPLQHLYARVGIQAVESGAWPGLVPAVLAVMAIRKSSTNSAARTWMIVGGVFFVWALGTHVHALGRNTGLIVPAAFIRYVPIAANARMPGRAMVLVYLALAMLSGLAIANIRRQALVLTMVAAAVLTDFWVAPLPLTPIACPPIYDALRGRTEPGALAELPLGVVDGLGEITPADHHMLVCQAIHERPIVGGVVARLPASILKNYRADPLIATWLRLSGAPAGEFPAADTPRGDAAASLMARDGIGFVLLNRRTASPELVQYVQHELGLEVLAQDEDRTLYRSRKAEK